MDDDEAVISAPLDIAYKDLDSLHLPFVWKVRRGLWQNNYRPVSIPVGVKFPPQEEWPAMARRDPPYWVDRGPISGQPGTGILCDGLRIVDIDLQHADDVYAALDFAVDLLGWAPIRIRDNACRILMLYRAAEGEPPKRRVKLDNENAVEILGRGQQFVAYHHHPSGSMYRWLEDIGPLSVKRDDLTAVNEDQIKEFLTRCADRLGIDLDIGKQFTPFDHREVSGDTEIWPAEDIHAALSVILNDGEYDFWLRIGMAVYAAAAGRNEGLNAWQSWSRDPASCKAKWRSFRATRISAGTLAYYARMAVDGWARPSKQLTLPLRWSKYPV